MHQEVAAAGAMRNAEMRCELDRVVQPFTTSNGAVDFRPRTGSKIRMAMRCII